MREDRRPARQLDLPGPAEIELVISSEKEIVDRRSTDDVYDAFG
jgi:hypothetical protein